MKQKKTIWYGGYFLALLLAVIRVSAVFSKEVNSGLELLLIIIFSVSFVQLKHIKMMDSDKDYIIEVSDERNITIKEKAGNITNIVTLIILGIIVILFIVLDYIIPAIILGTIVVFQPLILMIISTIVERRM